MHSERVTYGVVGSRPEAPGVTTIEFIGDGRENSFAPGQYLTVYLPESDTPVGKVYSISSAPHEPVMEMTVRDIGTFSHYLATLRIGDSFTGSLPYGFFSPQGDENPLVMIAGGIGITPFRSMLRDARERTPLREVCLFHSVRNSEDALFRTEFELLNEVFNNFSFHHFITREAVGESETLHEGRVTAERILSHAHLSQQTEFLICGSIGFTRDMWRSLRSEGINPDMMYTEAFFTHG